MTNNLRPVYINGGQEPGTREELRIIQHIEVSNDNSEVALLVYFL